MIQILDEQTINQIAAGEVIENPASVVKELVENALDAGATAISVETQGGGRGLIRIADNGSGMGRDDLTLALQRHATSKIKNVNDLENLFSLGFRGEALPSIAAVSKMQLESSLDEKGFSLAIAGGKLGALAPCARKKGTTIEVRSLFFNVPVRRKFQKSVASDVAEIHRCLTKMALAHPELSFSWKHEGVMQFELTRSDSLLDRIKLLLGEEFASNLVEVKGMGYLSKPSFHRPNRTGQYLSINRRPVSSPFLSKVIQDAYHTRLPERRFPLFILHLDLSPEWVDVNVHPQKKEVRLREKSEIASQVVSQIQNVFAKETIAVKVDHQQWSLEEKCAVYHITPEKEDRVVIEEEPSLFVTPRAVMGVMKGYILTEEEEGVRLFDIAAIDYALHFEMLRQEEVEKQALLFPQTIEVTEVEKQQLIEQIDLLKKLGISIRLFGERTFIIDAIPVYLEAADVESLVHELLEQNPDTYMKVVAKKGRRKVESVSQATLLLQKLDKCGLANETPDGKPISSLLTIQELKKRFE
ncbi:MAG: DNA mismatch repair protein MutL [Chlamydiales bacterium]|nr:DNA mismatch repair protein MutL [Chlamydiales bacterium]MCH9619618.1 DNA mismatch repair protein MutL [Chlamydiales bacterium]MCH9623224.1 DNA mismatch repair protein MutL [Chlamydiales bacterium]